jgi:thiamine biosynthesis lipoprotein
VDLRADADAQSTLQIDLQQKLDTWESNLSHWRPDSALSRFNSSTSTDWIAVPAELIEVVELAQQIGHDTEHALDVTIAPLVELWGFGAKGKRDSPPAAAEINAAKARCGWQHLQTRHDPPALRKTIPDLQINVSAVAEGWALDKIAKHLESKGITNFLSKSAAKSSRGANGVSASKRPPLHPAKLLKLFSSKTSLLPPAGCIVKTSSLKASSAPTSSIHAPDDPSSTDLASVSVIHSSAAQADGYATALLVLGPSKGRELAEKLGLRVVWFEQANEAGHAKTLCPPPLALCYPPSHVSRR